VSEAATPIGRVFSYATSVTDHELGIYKMVVEATMSPTFEGRASVADLWASLPELPTSRQLLGDRPRSVILQPVRVDDGRPLFARIASPTHGAFRYSRVPLEDFPTTYPTTAGMVQDGTREGPFGTEDPVFMFPREDESLRPLHEDRRQAALLR
jgi:hypothetical protein